MESTEQEVLTLLRRELAPFAITEPYLQDRTDAVLRAGEHVIVVEAKVSTRSGVPFGVSDVQHVLDQQQVLKRDVRVLLQTEAFELALITNRSLTDRTSSLLLNSGLRVFRFDQDPAVAIQELKEYVTSQMGSASPQLVRPIDQWTLAEVRAISSATTPEETLRAFVLSAGLKESQAHTSLVAATNQILQHYAAPVGPPNVRGLADHVRQWLFQAEMERLSRNMAVDLIETIQRLLRRVAFLEELVRSNAWAPSFLRDTTDSIRAQDVALSKHLRQAEKMAANPASISPGTIASMSAAVQGSSTVLEDLAQKLQDRRAANPGPDRVSS